MPTGSTDIREPGFYWVRFHNDGTRTWTVGRLDDDGQLTVVGRETPVDIGLIEVGSQIETPGLTSIADVHSALATLRSPSASIREKWRAAYELDRGMVAGDPPEMPEGYGIEDGYLIRSDGERMLLPEPPDDVAAIGQALLWLADEMSDS
jgi:hypothetical protein